MRSAEIGHHVIQTTKEASDLKSVCGKNRILAASLNAALVAQKAETNPDTFAAH